MGTRVSGYGHELVSGMSRVRVLVPLKTRRVGGTMHENWRTLGMIVVDHTIVSNKGCYPHEEECFSCDKTISVLFTSHQGDIVLAVDELHLVTSS
ncbi:hypothetical protein TNCV_3371451 [Trichonephila clavipes]|nr:hypothetical protein TNCV_3371451 [Trichonephila clavipes]